MGNNNQYDNRILLKIINKLLTFDQDACLEYVRNHIRKDIRRDKKNNRLKALEEYISWAMTLTTFYFTSHHIPYLYYRIEFVEEKYPELLHRIKEMVRETYLSAKQS